MAIADPKTDLTLLMSHASSSSYCSKEMIEHDVLLQIMDETGIINNKEQAMALRIVCEHIINGNQQQLLMHIAGTGGTGKSYVIEAIMTFFERTERSQQLLVSAPTGCAAVLIQGNTIHSLTSLPR